MKKLKNIILVIVAVSLVRCQKKSDETTLELQNQNIYTGEIINKETVELDNPIILKQVNKINENNIKSKGTKAVYPTIKTGKSLRIIGESMTSYTFEVASENTITSGIAQNYILVQYTDNSFIQYFANYKINEYGIADKYPFEIERIKGNSLVSLKSRGCTEDVAFVNDKNCLYLDCTAGGNHNWADKGECTQEHTSLGPQKICETTSVTFQTSCPNTGGGGGTNTGSGTSQGGSESITVGFWSSAEIIARRLQLEQSSEELKYLKDNPTIASIINREFMTIPSDPVKLEFAEEAIKTLINGGEVDFDDKIINELSKRTKCIFKKLLNSSTGFKGMIQKFDGDFPVSHLKLFLRNDLPLSSNARTSPPKNYVINVGLNPNKFNRPNLSIARTIIHEVIHAEMFRKMISLANNNGSIDKNLIRSMLANSDYPGMFDYFSRFGVNNFQHNLMGEHYITTMKDVLKEFQPGLPEDIYTALAWTGLKNTVSWNNLSDVEKNNINNTKIAFDNQGSEPCI